MKTQSIIDYLSIFDGNIEDIKDLTINRFDIVKDIQEVDLNDLLNFPNLTSLTFNGLVFNEKEFEILDKLNNLTSIMFVNCDLFTVGNIFAKIDNLILDNTKISNVIFDRSYNTLEIRHMKIDAKNISASNLIVNYADIDFNIIDFDELKSLTVSIEQYKNNKELFKSLNFTNVIVRDDNNNEVTNYENI